MNSMRIYQSLFAVYGPQGWWPLLDHSGSECVSRERPGGYHPGEYDFPRNEKQRFEICVGAILTQNTAWSNVEKALVALSRAGVLQPRPMLELDPDELAGLIRCAGYFNMKTRKLQEFARFYRSLSGRVPERAELLSVWGIGPETADSILLYAFARPEMVVDAYTRRVLLSLELIDRRADYDRIKAFCQRGLPREIPVYQEFHALMVAHGKQQKELEKPRDKRDG